MSAGFRLLWWPLALACAAVALAPAWLVGTWLADERTGIGLESARGSLWRGSGRLVLAPGGGPATGFVPVSWTLNPVLAPPGFELRLESPEAGHARLRRGGDAVRLAEIEATLPARTLASGTAGLGGMLALTAHELSLDSAGGSGSASVRWSEARAALPGLSQPVALGLVQLTARGVRRGLALDLASSGGDVELRGAGTLLPDWRLEGRLEWRVREAGPPALADWARRSGAPPGAWASLDLSSLQDPRP